MRIPLSQVKMPESRVGEEINIDFLADLRGDIVKNGQQVPILLDADYQLVDGLYRYYVASDLGRDEIEAVVAQDYLEAMDALDVAHHPSQMRRKLTPRRIWQIKKGLHDYMTEALNVMRRLPNGEKRQVFAKSHRGKNAFANVLRVGSMTTYAAGRLYREAEGDGPHSDYARELVKLMDEGSLTPNGAIDRFKRRLREKSAIEDIATQRRMMDRILDHLDSVEQGLDVMGPLHPDLTQDEIESWLKALYRTNVTLYRLRHSLKTRKVSP